MYLRAIAPVLVSLALVYLAGLGGIALLGSWTMVANGSELVYHYGSGLGTALLGMAAVYAIVRGMSKYEEASIHIEKEKLNATVGQENIRRSTYRFDLAMRVLPDFDAVVNAIRLAREPFFISDETRQNIADLYNEGELFPRTDIAGWVARFRMRQVRDQIRRLNEDQSRFKILFGSDEPFNRLYSCINTLTASANVLCGSLKDEDWRHNLPVVMDEEGIMEAELQAATEQLHSLIHAQIPPETFGRVSV